MKYILTWWERPAGTHEAYERAQQRVLELFSQWQMPEDIRVHAFVVRVGEFGGYALVETSSVAELHRLGSAFAVFRFRVEPVVDITDAVPVESAAIEWRSGIGGGSAS